MEACCLRDLGLLDEALAFVTPHLSHLDGPFLAKAVAIEQSIVVRQGRWSEGIARGHAYLARFGDGSAFAPDIYRNMAWCARHSYRWDTALSWLDTAESLFRNAGNETGAADCLVDRTQVLRQAGRIREAELVARSVADFISSHPDYFNKAFGLSEVARVNVDLGRHDVAAIYALQIVAEVPVSDTYRRSALAEALYVLARVAAAEGRSSEARQHVAGAVRLVEGIPFCQRLRREVVELFRDLAL
jgi:tetratricopeptide (TPR) repeat protein